MRTPSPAPRRGSDADVVKMRVELEKAKLEGEEKLSRERKRVTMENTVSFLKKLNSCMIFLINHSLELEKKTLIVKKITKYE